VEFDFASFNSGDYEKAVSEQTEAEHITSVLVSFFVVVLLIS
jgi:hypothetical protein